jgi:membrane protease YdiL (CAAX protease family)
MSETQPKRNRILARLGAPQTPPPWGMVDVAATLLVLALGILMLGLTIASFVFGITDPSQLSPMSLLFGWGVGLLVALGYTFFVWRRTPEQVAALRLGSESRLPLPYTLLLGVAVTLTLDLVIAMGYQTTITNQNSFLPAVQLVQVNAAGNANLGLWLLAGLFVVVLQPLAEGIIFLGVILPRLRASLSPYAGILATAALFAGYYALVYAPQLQGTAFLWYGVIMPFLLGIFLACVRVYSESTRAAILAQVGVGITLLMAAFALAPQI